MANRDRNRFLFARVPDNDLPLEDLLKKYIVQNEKRWVENERRWKENSDRWERNFKILGEMLRKIETMDRRLQRVEAHFT